jgi:hypothetical protein
LSINWIFATEFRLLIQHSPFPLAATRSRYGAAISTRGSLEIRCHVETRGQWELRGYLDTRVNEETRGQWELRGYLESRVNEETRCHVKHAQVDAQVRCTLCAHNSSTELMTAGASDISHGAPKGRDTVLLPCGAADRPLVGLHFQHVIGGLAHWLFSIIYLIVNYSFVIYLFIIYFFNGTIFCLDVLQELSLWDQTIFKIDTIILRQQVATITSKH